MPQKIYISNLSKTTANQTLAEKFSRYGIVYSARVINDLETASAWVEMASSEDAMVAIKNLDGTVIDGRLIHVREAGKTYLH